MYFFVTYSGVDFIDSIEVVHVSQKDGGLEDLVEAGAGGLEDLAHVGQSLASFSLDALGHGTFLQIIVKLSSSCNFVHFFLPYRSRDQDQGSQRYRRYR